MKINTLVSMFVVSVFFLVLASPVVYADQAQDSYVNFEANTSTINADSYIESNLGSNNSGDVYTEIDEVWEKAMPGISKKGVYVGSLFQSSLFELNNEMPTGTDFYFAGTGEIQVRYPTLSSIVLISSKQKFEQQYIMNGVSEFYVRIPVPLKTINNTLFNPMLYIFKSSTLEPSTSYSIRTPMTVTVGIDMVNSCLTNGSEYPIPEDDLYIYHPTDELISVSSWSQSIIYDDNIFYSLDCPLIPNQIYSFVFAYATNNKPQIYVTSENTNGNDNGTSVSIQTYNCGITPLSIAFLALTYPHFEEMARISLLSYAYSVNITVPVDVSFSFIMIAGMGAYGMYGKEISITNHTVLRFFMEVSTSTLNDLYPSIMLPFVSSVPIQVRPRCEILVPKSATSAYTYDVRGVVPGGTVIYVANHPYPAFVYDESITTNGVNMYWYPRIWTMDSNKLYFNTYTDFILVTIPQKLDMESFIQSGVTTTWLDFTLEFNTTTTITLFFSYESHSETGWQDLVSTTFSTQYLAEPSIVDGSIDETPLNDAIQSKLFNTNFMYLYDNVPYYDNWTMMEMTNQPFGFSVDTDYADFYNPGALIDYTLSSNLITGVDDFSQPHLFQTHTNYAPSGSHQNYKDSFYCVPDKTICAELFVSKQLTSGIWYERVTAPNGTVYGKNLYQERVVTGTVDIFIDTSDKGSKLTFTGIAMIDFALNTVLDVIDYIYEGMKTIISILTNPEKLFGWISDTITNVFSSIWKAMQDLGKWVIASVMSFVGWVTHLFSDIWDTLTEIGSIIMVLLPLILFTVAVSVVSRFLWMGEQ